MTRINDTSTFASLLSVKLLPAILDPSTDPIITFPKQILIKIYLKLAFTYSYHLHDQYKSFAL